MSRQHSAICSFPPEMELSVDCAVTTKSLIRVLNTCPPCPSLATSSIFHLVKLLETALQVPCQRAEILRASPALQKRQPGRTQSGAVTGLATSPYHRFLLPSAKHSEPESRCVCTESTEASLVCSKNAGLAEGWEVNYVIQHRIKDRNHRTIC